MPPSYLRYQKTSPTGTRMLAVLVLAPEMIQEETAAVRLAVRETDGLIQDSHF